MCTPAFCCCLLSQSLIVYFSLQVKTKNKSHDEGAKYCSAFILELGVATISWLIGTDLCGLT